MATTARKRDYRPDILPAAAPHVTTVTIALRVAIKYRDSLPTIEQLQGDFNMCRATAYRWRAAFAEVLQEPRRNHQPQRQL